MKASAQTLTTDINVTPFLDILLVLIITFLAAMSARKSMDVVLPEPCEGSCLSKDVPIVLEVLADGSFLLNQRVVTAAALLGTLHTAFDTRPDGIVYVAGHRDVHYQDVLAAMDVARSAGVKVISIPPSDSYSAK